MHFIVHIPTAVSCIFLVLKGKYGVLCEILYRLATGWLKGCISIASTVKAEQLL